MLCLLAPLLCSLCTLSRAEAAIPSLRYRRAAAAWISLSPLRIAALSPSLPSSASRPLNSLLRLQPRRALLTTMADTGKGKGAAAAGASSAGGNEKLGEAEVLNLVLDYLATKGFTEAEQTLRQSASAAGGSPNKGRKSNQQSGTLQAHHTRPYSYTWYVTWLLCSCWLYTSYYKAVSASRKLCKCFPCVCVCSVDPHPQPTPSLDRDGCGWCLVGGELQLLLLCRCCSPLLLLAHFLFCESSFVMTECNQSEEQPILKYCCTVQSM